MRFFIFSLVFPLALFLVIAGPNRDDDDLGGRRSRVPLYYMVGMAGYGAMIAVIAGGARIAAERSVGWNRQLRLTPLPARSYFRAKVLTGYADGRGQHRRCCTLAGIASACACRRALGRDDRLILVGPARSPRWASPRSPADRRLDGPGPRRRSRRSSASSAGRGSRRRAGACCTDLGQALPVLLAGAGQPRRHRRRRLGGRGLAGRRRLDGRAARRRPPGPTAATRERV